MATVGSGQYTYDIEETFGRLPRSQSFGPVSDVAVDSQDRVYVFQRQDPAIVILDREGNYLDGWGTGFEFAHGLYISPDDIVYLTDRDTHQAFAYTLEGKPLLTLGVRGQFSETGCSQDGALVPRAAGPFNKPTKLVPAPSGELYVSDGYRNSRVHRFTADGQLIASWGTPGKSAPGEFHLPHSVWVDGQGLVYVCDRENSRVQIFSPDGEFVGLWPDLHRPTDIYFDAAGTAYISELLPRVSVLDPQGQVLARWESPSGHGIGGDSRGNIYLAQVGDRRVTKYVRRS